MLDPIPKTVLKALTNNADVRVMDIVAHRLGPAAAPAVPVLIDRLSQEENAGYAAKALGMIGPATKQAIPALERMLGAKTGPWRYARIALLQIDPTNRVAQESLANEGGTLPLHVRAILAGLRGQWSPEGEALTREKCLERIQRNAYSCYDLYYNDLGDFYMGVYWVSQYGPGAKAAVPLLTKLLTHRDYYVRRLAADALRRIEGAARVLPPH